MPVGVWTQTVRLTWRPSLHYYEHRIGFLRELHEEGLVQAFRLSDPDEVEAKISPAAHELAFTSTSIEIDVLSDVVEWPRLDAILARAVELSEPNDIRGSVNLQLLAPLGITRDDANAASTLAWFGQWKDGLGISDHALLLDVEDTSGDFKHQAEFGIVQEDEILRRIQRFAGRAGAPRRGLPPHFSSLDLPDVAIFMDSRTFLRRPIPVPEDVAGWLVPFRERAREFAIDLCGRLEDSVMSVDKQGGKVQI